MTGPHIPVYPKVDDCPDVAAKHTRCPRGYLQWHDWAAHKAKTHRQKKCPMCGFYAVWVPKVKPHGFDGPRPSGSNTNRVMTEASGPLRFDGSPDA